MRQEGKEKESRDPLSIPRAASHKQQKLVKVAKDKKPQGIHAGVGAGPASGLPTIHTYTQEIRLLSRGPQECPTGMGGLGEQGHHASDYVQ